MRYRTPALSKKVAKAEDDRLETHITVFSLSSLSFASMGAFQEVWEAFSNNFNLIVWIFLDIYQ